MSLEVGVHHTPQEVREIVAWQRYQEQRSASLQSNISSKTAIDGRSSIKKHKEQMSSDNGGKEEALYSNSDFHKAPEGGNQPGTNQYSLIEI